MRLIGLAVVLSLALAPLAGEAQQISVARIGVLTTGNPRSAGPNQAFEQKLRELGYVEGQNLAIEARAAEGKIDRLPDLAAELVRSKVDLIVASGSEATLRAVRKTTSTIPIVMVAIDYDPIKAGYISSLSHPGGNITGVFFQQLELTSKRLEICREAVPKATRVAILWDAFSANQLSPAETAAQALGLSLLRLELKDPPYDYEGAIQLVVRRGGNALFVPSSPLVYRDRTRIANAALKNRLPTIFAHREHVEAGGFIAYGPNMSDMYRRAAVYVDRILKGAKPADLPVEQPTKFELVINLKTAKAIGVTIPQSLLLRADQVIQ